MNKSELCKLAITINVCFAIASLLYLLFLFINFPNTQTQHSIQSFREYVEKSDNIENIKERSVSFLQVIGFAQNLSKGLGLFSILYIVLVILVLIFNRYVLKQVLKT